MRAARALKRLLLLCITLILAQLALAGHGIEHAFHEPDEACVECLALPGMQAVPAQVQMPPLRGAVIIPATLAVPPAPTFFTPTAFRSRAPPLLLN
jgi:hypothetical protein